MQRRALPTAAALLLALAALLPAASGYEFDMVRRRPAAAGRGTAAPAAGRSASACIWMSDT